MRIAEALIQTAKLNGVNPQAWLTDALEYVVSERTKVAELETLLPWNWNWNWKSGSSAAPIAIPVISTQASQ